MKDETTKKSVPFICCPDCHTKAERIGAQDFCDVYKCFNNHISRYEVSKGIRFIWHEETI